MSEKTHDINIPGKAWNPLEGSSAYQVPLQWYGKDDPRTPMIVSLSDRLHRSAYGRRGTGYTYRVTGLTMEQVTWLHKFFSDFADPTGRGTEPEDRVEQQACKRVVERLAYIIRTQPGGHGTSASGIPYTVREDGSRSFVGYGGAFD